jgi:tRNA1(Val) A37 N6-methylase TrmN6
MNYQTEKLDENIKICFTNEHRFGTDAFLLADFAKPRHKDNVCDLGTGCGIIPLVLEKRFSPNSILGIDIQPLAINQFQQYINLSNLQNKITALQGDLKTLPKSIATASFDVVTCNPPYKIFGRGLLNQHIPHQIARHEVSCNIQDVCVAGSKLLKFGGKLCLCQRPERLLDTMQAMQNAGIEPKRLKFVAKQKEDAPWLFLIEGKKGGKPFLKVEATLFVQGENGFSDELLKVYGK